MTVVPTQTSTPAASARPAAARHLGSVLEALINNARHQTAVNEALTTHLIALGERLARLERIAAAAPVYLGDHTALARVLQRYKMYVDTRDLSLSPHLLTDGFWEDWVTAAWQRLLRPGMRVVDVGANVGYYALIAADGVGPQGFVWAFEPDPRNAQLLRWNLEVNGFADRSAVIEAAALDRPRPIRFARLASHFGSHRVLAGSADVPAGSQQIVVEAVALDDCLGEQAEIHLMKIDAEGAEPYIWDGMPMLLERNRGIHLVMEFDPVQIRGQGRDPAVFLEAVLRAGFVLEIIGTDGNFRSCTPDELLAGGLQMLHLARP